MIKLTMEKEEECNIGLSLGVGSHEDYKTFKKSPHVQFDILFPPNPQEEEKEKPAKRSKTIDKEEQEGMVRDKYDNTRKKLTLTKEQSRLLEESFREHHTLNLTEKRVLADRLSLRPRQVEVWFQNRRARNKLKQTEVDCEMLRKWCESLSDENRRLKKELQELRSAKSTYVELPKATNAASMLSICLP